MTTKVIAVVSCLLVLIGLIFCFESLQTGNHSSRLSYSDLTVPSQDQTEAPLPDSVHTCEPPAPNHPLKIHQEPIQIPDEQWGIIGDFEARLSEDIASSDLLRSVLIPVTDGHAFQ